MSERRAEDGLISVTVSNGKYTMQQTAAGKWEALRYGEGWPAFRDNGPDNLHVALAYEVAELRDEVASLKDARTKLESLESLRPHWAQGYTSDSMAAQSSTAALSQVFTILGVDNQTAAMQKLRQLVQVTA